MRKEIFIIILGLFLINSLIGEASASTYNEMSEKPIVEVFVFSYCPFGLQFEKAMQSVYGLLKNKADIRIIAIGEMHGEYEKKESLRQICIEKNYGKDKLWDYLNDFSSNIHIGYCEGGESCVNPLIENIFLDNEINLTYINNCIEDDAEEIYNEQNERASELGIAGSPTLVINNSEVDVVRNPENIKDEICKYFDSFPIACSVELSSKIPAPGFGEISTDIDDIQNQKIFALESWKQTIEDWKDTLTETINNILNKLTNHESRIKDLENKTCECPITFPNYFKYLSASDRKKMVCDYAQESHLTSINDLGFKCTITYKKYRGGERANCKCSGK